MQVATWNVNSLNIRLDHVLAWLENNPIDALALQETKLPDERFPSDALAEAGYYAAFAGQKTYNGVALLAKTPPVDIVTALPGFEDDQKRVLAATINGARVISVYCPNGSALDSPKFTYKLDWFAHLRDWLVDELSRHEKLVVTGDFNVAPRPEDTYDPDKWDGRILCSPDERAALNALIDTGLTDCWRLFDDREGRHRFTWWDYRGGGWPQNNGLRIDHVLASTALAECCRDCRADVGERGRKRPSDHVPVIAQFE
ncbi:exodeoxyribonuclease III [Salinisphaera sp. USBA-960]|uniref:exodeoxyribonuclease III n=1 Tax=Salinisphaera orenii TaxID=856731 RepID=UPI000DBE5CE0|nr:exodeoxyribonuclease III [Salifodinibacter halophilus]NNC25399.1 exodeoxyribonuclease III [Salifodinibacter halophilus]